MKSILGLVLFAVSLSAAPPVTWYLNNVTFTDGGRAFGTFTYTDLGAGQGLFSAVNIQTTPAPATTSAASGVGGGNYNTTFSVVAAAPSRFVSWGFSTSPRRLQFTNAGTSFTGSGAIALAGTEGFCDAATCNNLVGAQSRSIATGQAVRFAATAPTTFYLLATMDDGSQAIGTFDFDATTGTYSNVDIAITGGSVLSTSTRLRFSRPLGNSPTVAVFQSSQTVAPGVRVFVMVSGQNLATNPSGGVLTPGAGGGGSFQGACPSPTSASCPVAVPTNVVAGTLVSTAPVGYRKVVSQVADGGNWQTGLIITNSSDSPAPYALTFSLDDGTPFEIGGIGSFSAATVPAGGTAFVTTPNASGLNQGYAKLIGGENFSVNAIFAQDTGGAGGKQQGSVPGDAQGTVSFSAPFDNTGGAVSGFAIASTSAASVTVLVVGYDENGKVLLVDSSVVLPPFGHTAFVFSSKPAFSVLDGKRGVLRVFAIHPGATPPYPGLNGLLLKFLPTGSFTTIAVTNQ